MAMSRFFEGTVALLREKASAALHGAKTIDPIAIARKKAGVVLDDARGLRDLATDIGKYAVDRVRERYMGATGPDPLGAVLDQILIDVANRLIEAKKSVALAIADEKRLANQATQEAYNATEWARRVALAENVGDALLVREARAHEQRHAQLAAQLSELWAQQKADVESLKSALRELNDRIERAKRDKNRILARQNVMAARRRMREDVRQIDDAIRVLDRLNQFDALVEREAPLVGNDEDDPLH